MNETFFATYELLQAALRIPEFFVKRQDREGGGGYRERSITFECGPFFDEGHDSTSRSSRVTLTLNRPCL